MKQMQGKESLDFDVKQKTKDILNLARESIFFPFTEPDVKSPVTGKKVSGRKRKEFNAQRLIWGKN